MSGFVDYFSVLACSPGQNQVTSGHLKLADSAITEVIVVISESSKYITLFMGPLYMETLNPVTSGRLHQ